MANKFFANADFGYPGYLIDADFNKLTLLDKDPAFCT